MSRKASFEDGIVLNADHDGLLSVDEEQLIHIIKKEPISNVYHVEQTPFARGKFAAVRKCTHQQSGRQYAAKFIRKRRRAMDQRQDILHEVAVLRLAADNHRIVRLHEVYETQQEMALVLELAAGGELQSVLDVQDGIQEPKAVVVMRQILEGLSFLHDRNIAHLDLKPQNLLLTGEYPDCDIKLCDFGISRVIQSGIEVREILGTPDYVAPEILSYEPITLATDIWSVGVLAYVVLSGFSPFGGETKQETFLNISQCSLSFPDDLFEDVSSTARDFIRATLQTQPKKRLTARQCLEHPWLAVATEQNVHIETEILLENHDSNGTVIQETELVSTNGGFSNGLNGGVDSSDDTGRLNGVVVKMSQDFIIDGCPEGKDSNASDEIGQCRIVRDAANTHTGRTSTLSRKKSFRMSLDCVIDRSDRSSTGLGFLGSLNDSGNVSDAVKMSQDCVVDGLGPLDENDCFKMSEDVPDEGSERNGSGTNFLGSSKGCGSACDVVQMSPDWNVTSYVSLQANGADGSIESELVVRMSQDESDDVRRSETYVLASNGGVACWNEEGVITNGAVATSEGTECGKVVAEYRERRMVVESRTESDEDLPVNKRPKNCEDGCCLTYPVAQCCNLHVSSPEVARRVSSTQGDRSVIC